MKGKMGWEQDSRGRTMVLLSPTRVREATRGASPRGTEGGPVAAPDELVLPLAARRSAVALPTASGVARPAWALAQEMARSRWLRMAVRRHRTH